MSSENRNKFKVNILSAFRPLTNNITGGDFAELRYNELIKQGLCVDMYMLTTTHSFLVRLIYQLLKGRKYIDNEHISGSTEPFKNIELFDSFLSQILLHIYPRFVLNQISRNIGKSMNPGSNSLIHVHWCYPHGYYGLKIAQKYHIPCIITAHGSDIHTNPRKNKICAKYTLEVLQSADKVIFVSNALLESAKELGYSGDNAAVIPNGYHHDLFSPMSKKDSEKRTGWKRTKQYVVGFVGHLIHVKRADKFPEIFRNISEKLPDVEFVLVGMGELRDNIEATCRDLGILVTFVGQVLYSEVALWMNQFDVMILPSRNEGWPCVVQEAYACGVPVVGAAVGGIPENLGGLCPSVADGDGFEERFAEAVCKVLTGEYFIDTTALILRAHEYTWEKCVKNEIDVYKNLLNVEDVSQ